VANLLLIILLAFLLAITYVLSTPNGSWEPILDIYVSRAFQWYNELLNPMSFDPYNLSLKIRGSNSQNGNPLGSVWVHSLTLSYTPGSMKCDSWASHLAHTFASPCLGHEPKVRVATTTMVCHVYNPTYCKVMTIAICDI
jgi:hypothetical protein